MNTSPNPPERRGPATDLMSLRSAVRLRTTAGVESQRVELELTETGDVLVSLDLTDALGLCQAIAGEVAVAITPRVVTSG